MKKQFLLLILINLVALHAFSQSPPMEITRLRNKLAIQKTDTDRLKILMDLSNGYRFSNIDSGLYFSDKAILLSRKLNLRPAEAAALTDKGSIYLEAGNLPVALNYQFLALNKADEKSDAATAIRGLIINRIGNIYMELAEYRKAINYYSISKELNVKVKNIPMVYNEISNIGNVYEMMGKLDSAKILQQRVYAYSLINPDRNDITRPEMRERLGNVESRVGNYDSALTQYRIGVREALFDFDLRNLAVVYLRMAGLFEKLHNNDSSFYYAKKTIETGKKVSMKKAIYEASALLARLFKLKHQPDSALAYNEMSMTVKDSLYGPKIFQRLELITLNEQQRQQQILEENARLQYRYRLWALISALSVFLLIAAILFKNNRKQKKTNIQLNEQKEKISSQRNDLEKTLSELNATQTQLIQSEKMASLGELTAGIAHEIQNPLNFVNNFSEVNQEMIDELKEELKGGNLEEAIAIADSIRQNEEKINHHGKRADFIVKGMLQHSRTSTGEKQLTNINVLADEFIKLSYHGLRAKDKSFNAEMISRFDPDLPPINVVQQDIGRVLLNLFNNAFYAVSQKQKTAGADYKPEVTVSTAAENGHVTIKVKDNGTGIPDSIKDKIMQPFFTTKPTGEGTGLGLSLSYDMVVKGHGGSITIDSVEHKGSEFIIKLPSE